MQNVMLPGGTAAELPGVTGEGSVVRTLPSRRLGLDIFSWIWERELDEVMLPLEKALLERMRLQLEMIAVLPSPWASAPSRKEQEISLLWWPLPSLICGVRPHGLVQQWSRSFWLPVVEIGGVSPGTCLLGPVYWIKILFNSGYAGLELFKKPSSWFNFIGEIDVPCLSHVCAPCPHFWLAPESLVTPCQDVPTPDVTHNKEQQSTRKIKIKLIKRGCGCALLVTLTRKQRVMREHTWF